MSASPPASMEVSEMLDQDEWYKDPNGKFHRIADMTEGFREVAAERLLRLALHMAHNVFRDLYAYSMPQGEQAQWEVERGEAEAEHVTANLENAQRWMAQTPLCAALRGEKPYETWEPEETSETAVQGDREGDRAQIYGEIQRLEKAMGQMQITLDILKAMHERM